jgi:putative component of toxin-antitoxin plasmid stabilization module
VSGINVTVYEVRPTAEFEAWLEGLADRIAVAAVAERLPRVRRGLFGD